MKRKMRKRVIRLFILLVTVWIGISIAHNFGATSIRKSIYEGKTHLALKVIRSPLMNVNAYDGPILFAPLLVIAESPPTTPLETACYYANLPAVEALMKRGANPNKGYRTNALKSACGNFGNEIVRYQVIKLIIDDIKDVNAYEKTSWTPLFLEVIDPCEPDSEEEKALLDIVCLLMDRGAHPVSPFDGETVMHLAAERNRVYMLDVFINRYELDVDMRNGKESTPLMYAAEKGVKEAVQYLLDYGADKTAVNRKGKTAYDLAVKAGHDDIAQLLKP